MEGPKYPNVTVQLTGKDGNAFAIIGRVAAALNAAGVEPEKIAEYRTESTSGNYDHVLQTAMAWVEVQ